MVDSVTQARTAAIQIIALANLNDVQSHAGMFSAVQRKIEAILVDAYCRVPSVEPLQLSKDTTRELQAFGARTLWAASFATPSFTSSAQAYLQTSFESLRAAL